MEVVKMMFPVKTEFALGLDCHICSSVKINIKYWSFGLDIICNSCGCGKYLNFKKDSQEYWMVRGDS
jgi:hypothetical protein